METTAEPGEERIREMGLRLARVASARRPSLIDIHPAPDDASSAMRRLTEHHKA
jgi:hypothetical protein